MGAQLGMISEGSTNSVMVHCLTQIFLVEKQMKGRFHVLMLFNEVKTYVITLAGHASLLFAKRPP